MLIQRQNRVYNYHPVQGFFGSYFSLVVHSSHFLHKIFKRLLGMEFAQNCQSSIEYVVMRSVVLWCGLLGHLMEFPLI